MNAFVLSTNLSEIRRIFIVQSTSSISHSFLQDFDWKLQLAISSDKMSSIREPLLLLRMDIHHNNTTDQKKPSITKNNREQRNIRKSLVAFSSEQSEILIELPRSDLEKVIETLEGINQNLQDLKT